MRGSGRIRQVRCITQVTLVLSFIFLFFATTPPAVANTASRQKPKDVILSLEQQWRTASLASDSATLDKLLSDDYVGISWNGQVSTKAMQLDRIRTHTFILSKLDVSDVKVKVVGPIAIVTSTADIEGRQRRQPHARHLSLHPHLPAASPGELENH